MTSYSKFTRRLKTIEEAGKVVVAVLIVAKWVTKRQARKRSI